MPSNARMTFRFEPAKPKLPDRPAERPTMRIAESADKPAEALESRTAYPDIEIVGTPGMPMELADDEIYVERNPPRADDFAAWDSPYQDDIRALEEMIRKSGSDTPAQPGKTSAAPSGARRLSAPPASASAFASRLFGPGARTEAKPERGETGLIEIVEPKGYPYDDRNEDGRYEEPSFGGRSENGWYDSIGTTEIVRETGPSWGRVVLSVAGAIGTGVLFGYLVLGLFTGEPFFPGQSSPQSEPRAQATATAQGVAPRAQSANSPLVGETEDGSPAVADPVPAAATRELGSERYYVLQYGVFRTADSMEIAAGELREKGYSAATDTTEGFRVYAAAAPSKDEAELLAAAMPGTEVYIKPIGGEPLTVPANGDSAVAADYVAAASEMIRELIRMSAGRLLESEPAPMEGDELSDWEEKRRSWMAASANAGRLTGPAAKEAEEISQRLDSAVASVTEFNRNPSRERLRSVQSDAMAALFSERRMRELIRQEN